MIEVERVGRELRAEQRIHGARIVVTIVDEGFEAPPREYGPFGAVAHGQRVAAIEGVARALAHAVVSTYRDDNARTYPEPAPQRLPGKVMSDTGGWGDLPVTVGPQPVPDNPGGWGGWDRS